MQIKKKLAWIIKRHPYLYYIRFKLLSKDVSVNEIRHISYNLINKKQELPHYFKDINTEIFKGNSNVTDLDRVICISKWLRLHIKGGSGLSLSSEKALDKMLKGEGGVCSDIAQVFNNFCLLNDIQVREWGITSFPFKSGFGGHAFNEFYSKELNKWVLIDVSNTIMFYLKGTANPLSTLELFEFNKRGKDIEFRSFLESNMINHKRIENYFLQTTSVPFLICNYNNKTYDRYLDRFQSYVPIFIIHFWLFIIRKSYYYMFPLDDFKNKIAYDR